MYILYYIPVVEKALNISGSAAVIMIHFCSEVMCFVTRVESLWNVKENNRNKANRGSLLPNEQRHRLPSHKGFHVICLPAVLCVTSYSAICWGVDISLCLSCIGKLFRLLCILRFSASFHNWLTNRKNKFKSLFICLLTYSMEQSPNWGTNRFSASQETPHILWNPKVHFRIHNFPPSAPVLSQLHPVHTPISYLLKIYLNIIPIYVWVSQVVSFPQVSPPTPCIGLSYPHTHYMPHPSNCCRFDHPNNIWWGVQIIKLLIMQLPPLPCYLVPPIPKYSLEHPILKHPQCQRPSSTPIQHNRKNYSSVFLDL